MRDLSRLENITPDVSIRARDFNFSNVSSRQAEVDFFSSTCIASANLHVTFNFHRNDHAEIDNCYHSHVIVQFISACYVAILSIYTLIISLMSKKNTVSNAENF